MVTILKRGGKGVKRIRFIGAGALGLLFADQMRRNLPEGGKIEFVMDAERLERHRKDIYTINGEEVQFAMLTPEQAREEGPADLILVGVKYPQFASAMETMASSVGEETTILSMMNGVDSEELLGKRFGREKVLFNVSQGMDAQRYGTNLTYTQHGHLYIGVPSGEQLMTLDAQNPLTLEQAEELRGILLAKLDAVCRFFDQSGVSYVREENILHRIWSKFMLNVGCNQVCMVADKGYGPCLEPGGLEFALMTGAMREVCALAQAKGIMVGEKELAEYIALEKTLDPNAVPSMGQDRRQKRRSEVDMFAGTVIRQGRELGLEMPVNEYLLRRVREIEAQYGESAT